MATFRLFHIYHSFLKKKWYLFFYIVLLLLAAIIGVATFAHFSKQQDEIILGVVDHDQTSETKLILSAIDDQKQLSKKFNIVKLTEKQASEKLKSRQITGFISFEKGMTQAFYDNGQLPIAVHTFDKTSIASIAMNQLSESVYNRLMISEAGIVTFIKMNGDASQEKLVLMMTELLLTGVERTAAFSIQDVKTISFADYFIISMYFTALYLLFISFTTLLKMNEDKVMQQRLKMYHFSKEKLMIIRHVLSLIYTAIIAGIAFFIMNEITELEIESYNYPYLFEVLAFYLFALMFISILVEIVGKSILKIILSIFVLVLSGAFIPTIYLSHFFGGIMDDLFFAQLFQFVKELVLNNYILDFSWSFYSQLIVIFLTFILAIIWRYRR